MNDSNLHTCEKAALGWQREGTCQQCELEENFVKFGGGLPQYAQPSSVPAQPEVKRHLAHETRAMFESRLAKYNDPKNLDWEFEKDVRDKWQRHAYAAYQDLRQVESDYADKCAELERVRQERDELTALIKNDKVLDRSWSDENLPMCVSILLNALYWRNEAKNKAESQLLNMREALTQALRQWRGYYVDMNEDDIETADHAEGERKLDA